MSIFDQQQLLASIHPFDLLNDQLQVQLIKQMDIAYYPKETLLIGPALEAVSLYIIIKGSVHEYFEGELQNVYGAMDSFDANALIYSKSSNHFRVEEDLICYELPKAHFLNLIQDHEAFQHYFLEDFISKHQQLKKYHQNNDLTPFMVAKVDEIFLHAACIVASDMSISDALQKMKAAETSTIIVKEHGIYGIVTDSNLRDKVLMGSTPLKAPIRDITSFPLITIDKSDFLFNALLMFTKYGIKRLVVVEDKEVMGVLEQLDLLSFFANNSHLVMIQIDKAKSINDLKLIQSEMLQMIRSLSSKGVKVRYISKLVNTLNSKIYHKVFELNVPESMRQNCALIVMGSEGRNEQILKTDQDNALIVSDDSDLKAYEEPMMNFNANLDFLGFPKCPGNIMVSNPYWRREVSSYKKLVERWLGSFESDDLQSLAVFLDAQCVAGDPALLDDVKSYLFSHFEGRDDLLAHLAKAVLNFETPLSLFSSFVVEKSEHKDEMDLKKGGIFAIVHGVRVLSLQHKVYTTNTTERIKALRDVGVINKEFSKELIEAYDTLLSIRMKARLKGVYDLNYVDPRVLEKIERDLLKDSFKVVNNFKKFLTFHFHLNVVS